jgi:hypothetical protein
VGLQRAHAAVLQLQQPLHHHQVAARRQAVLLLSLLKVPVQQLRGRPEAAKQA